MVKYFQLFLFFLLISFPINAQSISVSASTDTTNYKVGDYITFSIEIKHDKNIKVEVPNLKDSLKILEFIKSFPVEKKEIDNKEIEIHKFIFSKYDSGKVEIPSIKIFYLDNNSSEKKVLSTSPFSIVVQTLQVNRQEDIRDIKEPIKIPWPWWIIALIILGIAIFIYGAYYLYRFIKKKKNIINENIPEIKIPPHEIALNQLYELKEKKLWQSGKVKDYHSELTNIIRSYFEARFNFRALEMPSSEILPVLSIMDDAKEIFSVVERFFTNADLVKFAKYEPMPQVNEEMLQQAFEIVKKTIPEPIIEEAEKQGDVNVK